MMPGMKNLNDNDHLDVDSNRLILIRSAILFYFPLYSSLSHSCSFQASDQEKRLFLQKPLPLRNSITWEA